jgi:hypothetical protein
LNGLNLLREYLGWVVKSYGNYELGGKTMGKIDSPSLIFNKTYPYIDKTTSDFEDDVTEENEDEPEHWVDDVSNVSLF